MSNLHRYLFDRATRREFLNATCLLRMPVDHDPASKDRIFWPLIQMRERLEKSLAVNFHENERELRRD